MKTPRSHSAMMFLTAGTALMLAASLVWHFRGGHGSSGSGSLIAAAAQLENKGDTAGAEKAYRQILASDPAHIEARRALARLADERAAAQEARMEQASAKSPPESPQVVAERMAAAQAQMNAMMSQFITKDGTVPATFAPAAPQPGEPPESPESLRQKMAAAQAQMAAMMGQATPPSAPPAGVDPKLVALEPRAAPAPSLNSSAGATPAAALAPPATPLPSVPVMQPAIPPPGVPLTLATSAPSPKIMPPPVAPPPAADSRALYEYIDGINPGTGTFTQTGGGRWIERCPDGNIFEFDEQARQSDFVELYDATRQIGIRLQAKGTLVRQASAANGGWQELYPGGWRDKTRPNAPKVVVRMIPEDVGLNRITSPVMSSKPADARPAEIIPATGPNERDLKLLQGEWVCVAMRQNGTLKREYEGMKAIIKGDALTWIYHFRAGEDNVDRAAFTINATTTPRRFNWYSLAEGPQRMRLRIYSVEGDTLHMAGDTTVGRAYPASFERANHVFQYKRVPSPSEKSR